MSVVEARTESGIASLHSDILSDASKVYEVRVRSVDDPSDVSNIAVVGVRDYDAGMAILEAIDNAI